MGWLLLFWLVGVAPKPQAMPSHSAECPNRGWVLVGYSHGFIPQPICVPRGRVK